MSSCFDQRPITYTVDDNGCHICTSHKNQVRGYPMITRDGRNSRPMIRYLWEKKNGPIPKDKKYSICHKCDKPACINVDHVWLGN